MARFRETPCMHYIAYHNCLKGRAAQHSKYCQHCDKYRPRAKVKHVNRKKRYISNIKSKGEDY